MSPAATQRLEELEQQFQDSPPRAPTQPKAQWASPPISEDATEQMCDDDWIGALQQHIEDTAHWQDGKFIGGAVELARTLGSRAKENPVRFSRLALRFDSEIPAVAMREVIRNVEGQVETEILTNLCEHAHSIYGSEVGQSVCTAITRSKGMNSRLAALLGIYGRDTDPEHEEARTEAHDSQYTWEGDFLTAGLNSTRGQAALAIASALFAGSDHLDDLLPILEDLVQDHVLAVRVCAAEAVVALLNHQPETALDLAEKLFDATIDLLNAHTSERLLAWILMRDPIRFASVLAAALDGPEDTAIRAGRIWVAVRWRGQLPPSITSDFASLQPAARRGAAQAFASNLADSHNDLLQALGDDDPEVLKDIGSAFNQLDDLAEPDQVALIEAFMSSAAFPNQPQRLIHALETLTSTLPSNTIDVCERAVDIAGADLGDMGTEAPMISRELITVVLRLYRQGDAELRNRCLDIVDRLAKLNVYDLEHALEDER